MEISKLEGYFEKRSKSCLQYSSVWRTESAVCIGSPTMKNSRTVPPMPRKLAMSFSIISFVKQRPKARRTCSS